MTKDTEALREALTSAIQTLAASHQLIRLFVPDRHELLPEINKRVEELQAFISDPSSAIWATPASDVAPFVLDPATWESQSFYAEYFCGDSPGVGYIVKCDPVPPDDTPCTLHEIVDGVDLGPVSQPYPGADDPILGPEVEIAPVAWLYTHPSGSLAYSSGKKDDWADDWTETPLYAHPPLAQSVDPVETLAQKQARDVMKPQSGSAMAQPPFGQAYGMTAVPAVDHPRNTKPVVVSETGDGVTQATVDPVAGEEARLSRVEPVARAGIVARNAWDALRLVGGKFWRELPDDMQTLAICSARDGYELGRDNALAALKGPAA